MAIFRPSNINKRLVGVPIGAPKLKCSTGNAGQIGKLDKTPFISGDFARGCACYGGSNGGVFRITESNCGVSKGCKSSSPVAVGGIIICAGSSNYLVAATSATEVSRCWYTRNDANTTAQSVSGCTGWFVPTCAQLQTGYNCRTFWDSFSNTNYWSSNQVDIYFQSFSVNFSSGSTDGVGRNSVLCVRAFRCVTY